MNIKTILFGAIAPRFSQLQTSLLSLLTNTHLPNHKGHPRRCPVASVQLELQYSSNPSKKT